MSFLPVFIVGLVFSFVYLLVRLSARERDQRRRIELVERALENGAIDDQTKRELLGAVTNKRTPTGYHPLFLLGWVGLFAGLGMIGISMGNDHWLSPAIMTTAVSFGVLSVPLAARELQSRKHAVEAGRIEP